MQLNDFRQHVAQHHDAALLPNRFLFVSTPSSTKPEVRSGGCFYPLRDKLDGGGTLHYLGIVFHGDGAPMTFDALRDNAKFNECMLAHEVPYNKFTGTPRSKRWVGFLLSPQSPWKALHQYLSTSDDIDFVNNAGFIFKDAHTAPRKLLYNFAMAVRYPWEMTRNYELCLRLWEAGVEPALAVYISQHFTLNTSAETVDGPYDVIYPWSFLEESDYCSVGRFITGTPATLSTTENASEPNVRALWDTKASEAAAVSAFNAFVADNKLSLGKIVKELSHIASVQMENA